jgi:hypothetical protein
LAIPLRVWVSHSVAHRLVERLMATLRVATPALETGALMVVDDTRA